METNLDVALHLLSSSIAGYFVWSILGAKRKDMLRLAFIVGLIGGFLIDVDHFIDYFFVFGTYFNFDYFMRGLQFEISGKTYVFFHAFEYVIISAIIALLVKSTRTKLIFFTLALAMLLHLLTDMALFNIPFQQYFIVYRAMHGFSALSY